MARITRRHLSIVGITAAMNAMIIIIIVRLILAPETRASILGGWGVATPRFWAGGRGVAGCRGGSWTSRNFFLYLIMYRKYVRKC